MPRSRLFRTGVGTRPSPFATLTQHCDLRSAEDDRRLENLEVVFVEGSPGFSRSFTFGQERSSTHTHLHDSDIICHPSPLTPPEVFVEGTPFLSPKILSPCALETPEQGEAPEQGTKQPPYACCMFLSPSPALHVSGEEVFEFEKSAIMMILFIYALLCRC